MRWPWQLKPFVPCDRLCPLEVERRIAEAGKSEPMFVIGMPTPAEVEAYRTKVVAEMRVLATEFPPPCQRCPANREKASANG